jgi:hypothetical protein
VYAMDGDWGIRVGVEVNNQRLVMPVRRVFGNKYGLLYNIVGG